MSSMRSNETYNREDLRIYPNQTDVYFWIIVIVLLGVAVAGAVGPSPVLMWPTTLTILILPARAFLAWPEREIKKRQDVQATIVFTENGILPRLQLALTTLATTNGYEEPIQIIIGSPTDKINAAGSWRRHYLFIGQDLAQKLDSDLQTPERQLVAESALLHEIAHFLHKDVQRVGYTHKLLRGGFLITLWWLFFLLGWLGFAGMAGQAFLSLDLSQIPSMDPIMLELLTPLVELSPEQRTEMVTKMETINIGLVLNYVTNAFMPIIWMSFFLWLFFWRRMLRLQEYYADYFVIATTKNPTALRNAWLDYTPQSLRIAATQQKLPIKLREAWQSLLFQLTDLLPFTLSDWYQRLTDQIYHLKLWFAYHPTFDQRSTFLLNPLTIYESWQSIAVSTLALVLALEVLTTTPLIGYHIGSTYIVHFATLIIFTLLATWVLPLLVQQQAIKSLLKKSEVLIYGVRLGWIGLTFLLLLIIAVADPDYATGLLNAVVFSGGRFAGNPSSMPVDNALALTLSIIPAYLALQLLSLGAVLLLLFLYIRLQRQVVRTNKPINWRQRHWQLVFTLSVAVVTLVLTPLSDLLQGGSDLLFSPARLLSYVVGACCVLWLIIRGRKVS